MMTEMNQGFKSIDKRTLVSSVCNVDINSNNSFGSNFSNCFEYIEWSDDSSYLQ